MKKTISLFLALNLMLSEAVYAKEYMVFSENDIAVEDKASPYSAVTYTVMKNGKTLDDYNGENMGDIFAAYDETYADADGNYKISFKTQLPSGIFTVILAIEGEREIAENKLYYIKESSNISAREKLDESTNPASDILELKYDLGMDDKLITEETAEKTAAIYQNQNVDASELSYKDVADILNQSAAIAALSLGKIGFFSQYQTYFNLDADIKTWIEMKYIDSAAQKIMEEHMSSNYASVSDFKNNVIAALALTTVEKADGYGYVKDILKQYSDTLHIDTDKITDEVSRKLCGKKYDSIEKLNTDIDLIFKDSQNTGTASKSSRTEGGGVSSIGAPGTVPDISLNTAALNNLLNENQADKKIFDDLSDYEWAEEAIEYLYSMSVIAGKGDDKFAPADSVLREEFVKMAMRAAGFANIYGEISFKDVSEQDWFYQDVKNAYLSGIINGISDSEFGTGMSITRQDMAVILYNVLTKKGVSLETGSKITFIDQANIAEYAKSSVDILSGAGIINGYQDGSFKPAGIATRVEAAKMIYGIMPYIGR